MLPKTLTRQTQISKSSGIDDTLPLLGYDSLETLEEDLNYLRSVIKQLKGTPAYDTPLAQTLTDLANILAAAVFDNAQLTGTPTATTPTSGDYSDRIATTKYVTDEINAAVVSAGNDARFVYQQMTSQSQWDITHNLNKKPAVTVVDSAGTMVFGEVLYIDNYNVQLNFSAPFSGYAYLN